MPQAPMSPEALIAWLGLPLSGAATHVVPLHVSWHGRLMVLSWGLAVPVAALLARFFKVTPRQDWPRVLDNRFWWHGHRGLNFASVGLTVVAAVLVIGSTTLDQGATRLWHAVSGWTVIVLASVQVVSALLRGTKGGPTAPRHTWPGQAPDLHGDHYAMTPRRIWFERVHKSAGWATVLAALAAMGSGLWAADALRWMVAGLTLLWTVLLMAFIRWQRDGRCLDTYQAIWGPGLELPGHARPPVGFGVRRLKPGEPGPWQAAAPASPAVKRPPL